MQTLCAEADLLEKEMACLHEEFEQFVDSDEGNEGESEEINDF
jgi:hypothetical protein